MQSVFDFLCTFNKKEILAKTSNIRYTYFANLYKLKKRREVIQTTSELLFILKNSSIKEFSFRRHNLQNKLKMKFVLKEFKIQNKQKKIDQCYSDLLELGKQNKQKELKIQELKKIQEEFKKNHL